MHCRSYQTLLRRDTLAPRTHTQLYRAAEIHFVLPVLLKTAKHTAVKQYILNSSNDHYNEISLLDYIPLFFSLIFLSCFLSPQFFLRFPFHLVLHSLLFFILQFFACIIPFFVFSFPILPPPFPLLNGFPSFLSSFFLSLQPPYIFFPISLPFFTMSSIRVPINDS